MAKLNLPLVVVLSVIFAVGCGIKKETHQKALDTLATCQGELRETKKVRDVQKLRATQLEAELSATRAERDKKTAAELEKEKRIKALLDEMSQNKVEVETELIKLRTQRDQAEKRLSAFRKLNEKFRSLVDTGKLQVDFRNGQMVIKLPSEILFASGKADLSKAGKTALQEVLNILLEFKDRQFQVAGHTDDRRIRSRKFKNNWQLSSARALSVLQFMVTAGFEPTSLGAIGFGQHRPVAGNDTEEGRALNRRIEIILVPDLSELPNLNSNPS